jgi:uncharacterized membrane protein required for colicin V production
MWYDLLTLGILMYAMFRGATKGVVWQLATIAALLLCFFFSGSLSHVIAPFIRVEEPLNKWIAMLILYLGFSFVCFGVARVLHDAIESMRIEALDRHMGALLGLVKGAMFSVFLTFFLVTLSHSARESITQSESGYIAAVVIDRLDPVIPGDLHALLEPYLRRMDPRGMEIEHREDEYARRHGGDDRDDPFAADDRRDRDGVDGPPLPGRDLDPRRDDDRRLDGDRRDPRLSDDRPYSRDGRDDGPPGGGLDRPRDGHDPAFDDAALDSRPARRDADDFRDSARGDRRPDLDRDPRMAADDLGQPTREETDWLGSLPATLDEGLRLLARKAWRATRPEHRGELSRLLSSTSIPEAIRKTLRDWQNGRPDSAPRMPGSEASQSVRDWQGGRPDSAPVGDTRDERGSLERQIVRSLSGLGSEQRMAAEDIEAALNGVPDDVALNVLRDWRSDLRDQKPDGDTRQIDGSSLTRRIRRELARAGISVRGGDRR